MVRLLIQEGEGQHAIVPRYPDPYVANRELIQLPWQSTVAAIGLTGFFALVGKSQPGTFLKATAYLTTANVSLTAFQRYYEREVNRGVFKLDNIEPKPGKLWERTTHWTVDDTVVGGGLAGVMLALNPRALPGVGGWKRFLGAATVGCTAGGYFGEKVLGRNSAPLAGVMRMVRMQSRVQAYARLKQDPKAHESLSRVGKAALAVLTYPVLGMGDPFAWGSSYENADGGGMGGPHAFPTAPRQPTQQEIDQHTLIQIEFNKGELRGPDLENGHRAYKDSLSDRDARGLQEWLERLEEIKKKSATEAQYIWHHLATKEQEFYSIMEENREKDIIRREIQLLNNMGCDFALRDSLFAYHIADAQKRLRQLEKKDQNNQNLLITAKAVQEELPADWRDHHSPHLVADQIRTNWSRQKEVLGMLEQAVSMHAEMPSGPHDEQLKQVKQNAEYMKMNVEATERLLKDFEEQIKKADEYNGR